MLEGRITLEELLERYTVTEEEGSQILRAHVELFNQEKMPTKRKILQRTANFSKL